MMEKQIAIGTISSRERVRTLENNPTKQLISGSKIIMIKEDASTDNTTT